MKFYIQPHDDKLIGCFIDPNSDFKLSGVGLATCCEFFNNIGIDEFKPDTHTVSFLNRIDLNRSSVRISRRPDLIRKVGITISETLGKPRKYVDGHIWCFCAEGEGEICTEDDPKCDLCQLKIQEPQLCLGFPNRIAINSNPLAAAQRMKECALIRSETQKKMKKVGLSDAQLEKVLDHVYGPKPVGRQIIKQLIMTDPFGSAQAMKKSGFNRKQAYREMQKAGLAHNSIEGILIKVY